MLAVLSPAKSLDLDPVARSLPPVTQPTLLAETETLMKTTRKLSAKKLSALMSISPALAELNHQRFQDFATPFTADNSKPAALMFAGDVYVGLDAGTLDDADLAWAQDHLGILSGLYGVLRPLDLMQAYRLEMGTSLATRRGKNLYAFWGDRVAKELGKRVAGHADATIVNLASNEYWKVIPKPAKTLPGGFLDVAFKEDKGDGPKVISFMAKRARGAMARWLVKERVDRREGVKDFAVDDYRFTPELSTETTWTFTRPFRSMAASRDDD
ncbi:MAG: peroxide stress protein YaaA [Myxococcales bacterium]|nr:peroxide stress protein YaaA [Myxococcales bacterium]MCB9733610.1 peroxide stress protein YaaA [Deltaproteobacteria bacterium]